MRAPGAAARAMQGADAISHRSQPPGTEPGPRWRFGARLFRNESLEDLEFLLDEVFRLPGTRIRFGFDGLVGLIPGIGDLVAGLLSLLFPLAAWSRGLPKVTLLRMAVNLAIGVLVGSIPFAGDAFDIWWKPNRRNLRLLRRHIGRPHRHTWRDWAFLMLLGICLVAVFALPLVVLAWIVLWVWHHR